jgi:lysozyme
VTAWRTPGPLGADTSSRLLGPLYTPGRSFAPGPLAMSRLPGSYTYSTAQGFHASELALSALGIGWLKRIESLHLSPYDDQTGKPISAWVKGASIGYGHLILAGEWDTYKDGIDDAQAESLLRNDLKPAERAVQRNVRVSLQQYQYDALVAFAFNIGVSGFAGSSALRLINDPAATTAYSSLESAWKAWNKSQGKVMSGLNNRRNAEWLTWTSARYGHW